MRDRLDWDSYFMLLALLTAERSADPGTQVGSCIVSSDNVILGLGYNGPPRGIDPESIPWTKEGEPENTKYAYVVHSEVNALFNSRADTKNATIYTTLFPCNECAKALIQAGIKEIVYLSDKYSNVWFTQVAKRMLSQAGIQYRKFLFDRQALISLHRVTVNTDIQEIYGL
jgi:dCMP deaminase